jgi:hypothetical protein
MRKSLLIILFVSLMGVSATLGVRSQSTPDKRECLEACKKRHDSCLAQPPEADEVRETQRREACHAALKECSKRCEDAERLLNQLR